MLYWSGRAAVAHIGVAGPPAGIHRVGQGDARQERLGLRDVGLDLYPETPRRASGLGVEDDMNHLATLVGAVLHEPDVESHLP